MIVRPCRDVDIQHVFSRLAPARKTELTATAWHDSTAQLANELIAVRDRTPAPLWLAALFGLDSTMPVAIIGVLPFGPGLGGMVWAATPEWSSVAISSHRWWRKTFVPEVLGRYRRVEFTALRSDLPSRRWLAGLGFTEEGMAYRQGKRGEDFVHFAWVNPDHNVGVS